MKPAVKKVSRIEPGFVWKDPEGRHVVACGDARNLDFVASLIPDDKVDLALIDPPYNLSSTSAKISFGGVRKDMFLREGWDVNQSDEQFWAEVLVPILNTVADFSANVWCWTSDWWISFVKQQLRALGLRVAPTYHWFKLNPPHSIRKRNVQSATEYLAMAGNPDAYFDLGALPKQRNWHPAPEDQWAYQSGLVSQKERLKRDSGPDGKREDVNRTQKPLALTEALVCAGAQPEGFVVDTVGGTGTVLVAADRTGRRCVHVDQDPFQVLMALRRLKKDRESRSRK